MDGVNFSHILRREMQPIPDFSSTDTQSMLSGSPGSPHAGHPRRRRHDADEDARVETVTVSSTSGSSYTSCSHGSIPTHPAASRTPRGDARRGCSADGDEVAVGVVQRRPKGSPSSAADQQKGGFAEEGTEKWEEEQNKCAGLPALTGRIDLKPHMDLDDDSTSLRAYWDALFFPEVYTKLFYALRITLLVALPLGILARHPKCKTVFPAHVVLPLWGIVDSKYTVGEQLAASVVSYQCGVWMMAFGTVNNAWGLLSHNSAWWCSVLFSCFCVSMLGNVRGKRLFVLQTVMILQMENLPGGTELIYPVKVGRDMIMATTFAVVQVLLPPRSIAKEADELVGGGWRDIGRVVRTAMTAVWTEDPIQSVIALGKLSTDPLHNVFVVAPQKFFFIMYEPWESTLRLELRKERLEIMRLCTPRLHSITGTARSLVMKRVFNVYGAATASTDKEQQKDGEAPRHPHRHHHHHHHDHHQEGTTPSQAASIAKGNEALHSPLSDSGHEPFHDKRDDGGGGGGGDPYTKADADGASNAAPPTPEYFTTVRRSVSKLFGLGGPPKGGTRPGLGRDMYTAPFEATHGAAGGYHGDDDDHDDVSDADGEGQHGGSPLRSHKADRHVRADTKEIQKLRQDRLKVQYNMELRLRKFGKTIIKEPLECFLDCFDAVLDGLGKHLNPKETVENVPFDALQDASAELEAALNKIHFEVLIKSDDPVDPFVYSNTIFFHLSLIVLAERLVEYGRSMKNFDRKRYKSQWVRMWEFFFYDWWSSFFTSLPGRLSLATPHDLRIFKDAVKMTCAYGVGVMFTSYTDPDNVYYFGMAILMGVGWPTAGDTMVASVYRVTGMACACSIAYVATWHTRNLTQELAIALAGVFLALIFRDVPPYSHTAQYCSMLVVTALNSAGTKLVLLARIVSNSFTVMAYYGICIFLFPTSVLKITSATESKAIMAIAERFSGLTDVMTVPLYPDDDDQRDALQMTLQALAASRARVWGLVMAFGEWIVKAAGEPTAHGEPYPIHHQRAVYESLRRLAAVTDIVCTALQQLHRRDAVEHDRYNVNAMLQVVLPVMVQIDRRGRVVMQDFLDSYARPYEWSAERATRHLSEFLFLSDDMHRAFYIAHRRNTRALRHHFSAGVMNRTFAAAASANIIQPSFAAAAKAALSANRRQSLSAVGVRGEGSGSFAATPASFAVPSGTRIPTSTQGTPVPCASTTASPSAAPGSSNNKINKINNINNSNDEFPESTAFTSSSSQQQQQQQQHQQRPAPVHTNMSDVEEEEEALQSAHPPPVTNASVTRSIVGALKIMQDHSAAPSPRPLSDNVGDGNSSFDPNTFYLPRVQQQQGQPMVSSAGNPLHDDNGDDKVSGEASPPSITPTPSAATSFAAVAAQEKVPPNTSFAHVLQNQSMTAKDLEDVLMPMEKRAEDEEYQAFVAKRRNPQFMLQAGEFTLNHDLNAVISLLVGADIFFGEAEKLVKTMYHLNSYARSHTPAPGTSVWDPK